MVRVRATCDTFANGYGYRTAGEIFDYSGPPHRHFVPVPAEAVSVLPPTPATPVEVPVTRPSIDEVMRRMKQAAEAMAAPDDGVSSVRMPVKTIAGEAAPPIDLLEGLPQLPPTV